MPTLPVDELERCVEPEQRTDAQGVLGVAVRVRDAAVRRPLLSVATIGVLATVLNVVWVVSNRQLGGFGVDESAYISDAFEFHRRLTSMPPQDWIRSSLQTTRNAPLPSLVAGAAMVPFGRSATVALASQAALNLVAALAVTALTQRLASRSAALVAGIVSIGLPVALISSRYFHQSTAVTAMLLLSVLALVAAREGLNSWPLFLAGAAAGAMVLSRTMAVAFLPGLAVAAVLLAWPERHDRRQMLRLFWFPVGLVLVAGPWWAANARSAGEYLVRFGYGTGASQITAVPAPLRPLARAGLLLTEVRPILLVAAALGLAGWLLARRRVDGAHPIRSAPPLDRRATAAVASVVVVGFVALLTSSNLGSWFQMPLTVLAIGPVVALASSGAAPWRRAAASCALVGAVLNIALLSTWSIGASTDVAGGSLAMLAFAGTESSQAMDFAAVDRRFAHDAPPSQRRAAEREWADASRRLIAALDEVGGPATRYSFFGENRLMRAPTVEMIAQADGHEPFQADQPLRPEERSRRPDVFAAPGPGADRVLVVLRTPHYLEQLAVDGSSPDDPTWVDTALARDWTVAAQIPTPDGGSVVVLTHDDRN